MIIKNSEKTDSLNSFIPIGFHYYYHYYYYYLTMSTWSPVTAYMSGSWWLASHRKMSVSRKWNREGTCRIGAWEDG